MTFFEMLHKTAEILAGDNADEFFDYIIHSMDDDGGFLRTRWKRTDKTLNDADYRDEPTIILAALRSPFDLKHDTEYYEEETNTFKETLTVLKMQIFYYDLSDKDSFLEECEWSACVGYPYPIRIDLERGTAEYLDKVEID